MFNFHCFGRPIIIFNSKKMQITVGHANSQLLLYCQSHPRGPTLTRHMSGGQHLLDTCQGANTYSTHVRGPTLTRHMSGGQHLLDTCQGANTYSTHVRGANTYSTHVRDQHLLDTCQGANTYSTHVRGPTLTRHMCAV